MSARDDAWVHRAELPAEIAAYRGLAACPDEVLRDVERAIRHAPDEWTQHAPFGLWHHGRLLHEVLWLADFDVDWRRWFAKLRVSQGADHDAIAHRLGTQGLTTTYELVVSRPRFEAALSAAAPAAPVAVPAATTPAGESPETPSAAVPPSESGVPLNQASTPAAARPTKVLPHGAPSLEQFLTNKHDQLPLVKQWATARYGQDPLPGRERLLDDFREGYGTVRGVSEATMRRLRKALASEQAKRGGSPRRSRNLES